MKTTIIIIIIVALLVIGGIVLVSGGGERGPDMVPEFSGEDFEGTIVSLSDFRGKPIVVNSWAAWCPFCIDELPDFARLQEEFGDAIVVIAIDRAESKEKQLTYLDDLGVSDKLVFLLDPRDSFYRSIGGFSMPETLFVNVQGEIVIHKRGPMELDEMREKVLQILEINI